MSVKYEKFLQEQINSLDIEVSQLKGLVKAMLDTSRELYLRVEEIDDRVPLLSKEVLDEKSES
jgi:predicted nuclease with TOPRIM domain